MPSMNGLGVMRIDARQVYFADPPREDGGNNSRNSNISRRECVASMQRAGLAVVEQPPADEPYVHVVADALDVSKNAPFLPARLARLCLCWRSLPSHCRTHTHTHTLMNAHANTQAPLTRARQAIGSRDDVLLVSEQWLCSLGGDGGVRESLQRLSSLFRGVTLCTTGLR